MGCSLFGPFHPVGQTLHYCRDFRTLKRLLMKNGARNLCVWSSSAQGMIFAQPFAVEAEKR
jgi:hypothetical protein